MNILRRIVKALLFTLYVAVFFGVTGRLFFEAQFNGAIQSVKNIFLSRPHALTIALAEPFINQSPLANDTGSRGRLLHEYEALVRVTPDLQIAPALAISYGSIDDTTWEFRLRPNILFHDGSLLTIDDVISSLGQAGIKNIKKIDDQIFRIPTAFPDPLLLQKLSGLFIFSRKNGSDGNPLGTGPFTAVSNQDDTLTLKRFEKYWDAPLSPFDTVTIKTLQDKEEKTQALEDHGADIVQNVPPDRAADFKFPSFTLETIPSLEVNFILFNFEKAFKQRELREAVYHGLNSGILGKLVQGFAISASQYVGNGIFGFDPTISAPSYEPKRAEELVKSVANFSRITFTLDLPQGLDAFGVTVKEELRRIGIDAQLIFLGPAELEKKIKSGESDAFFLGWRTELGDAADFLTSVAHSATGTFGEVNGGKYRNPDVDALIESSQKTVKQAMRLKLLRSAMRRITLEDIIGVPLFSPQVLYGVSNSIKWKPRIDGYILAQEVKI